MKNTALILVDMQNAFCSKKGSFWKRGYSIFNLNKVLRIIKSLLTLARRNNWLVIFTRLAYKSNYSDAGLLVKNIPEIIKFGGYIENTWDSKIVKTLKPKKQEIIINKKRYDTFYNTNLETILRKNRIQKLVIAGLLTNVCVESCIRSAFDRNFEVILVRDGTSTYSKELYRASLINIEKHFGRVINFKKLKTFA